MMKESVVLFGKGRITTGSILISSFTVELFIKNQTHRLALLFPGASKPRRSRGKTVVECL
jgi:hypothetical protein